MAWGERDRYHITGTVNGLKIRGPLVLEDGAAILVLPPAWRRASGIDSGSPVDVVLAPEGPQENALPDDIAAALDAEPEAKAFFVSLATFYRKAYLTWLAGSAKRPEVRKQRIDEFVSLLKQGTKQR